MSNPYSHESLTNTERLIEVANFQAKLEEAQLIDYQEVVSPTFKLVIGPSKTRIWGK